MRKAVMTVVALLCGVLGAALVSTGAVAESRDWKTNQESVIVDETTVLLKGTNTSVETDNLGMSTGGVTVSFTFDLLDGTKCAGGAPRVFAKVDDGYHNSWDDNADQCGGDDGVVTFALPAGQVTHFGLVYDSGTAGAVRVSGVKLGNQAVTFRDPKPEPTEPTQEPTQKPTTEPTVEPTGTTSPLPTLEPVPSGSTSGTPTLPVTGGQPLVALGVGFGLLLAGGALLVIARRNRDFTWT